MFLDVLPTVHERAFKIVPDDHNSSYSEFPMTEKEHTIYQHNINVLIKEISEFENNPSPPLNDDMF